MAMVFGVLFGSVFCREDIIPALWIRPLADPITVCWRSVIAAVAVMTLGLLLDAIQMHWRGEAPQWWAHHAGLFTAYAGLLISPFRSEGLMGRGPRRGLVHFGAAALTTKAGLSALIQAAGEFVEQRCDSWSTPSRLPVSAPSRSPMPDVGRHARNGDR